MAFSVKLYRICYYYDTTQLIGIFDWQRDDMYSEHVLLKPLLLKFIAPLETYKISKKELLIGIYILSELLLFNLE